ncbi:MAG: RDD family protein [Desulfuromusa sp.]|nr:RDD family protein [Desulfuromusa sp.]
MRCPKCGYNSFDHLDSCKKCGKDLVEFKQSFGIKSVLFPGQMSPGGGSKETEFDSMTADAAVSAATGVAVAAATATAVSAAGDEPVVAGADGDDFGFDFMGDSAEDDDLSFDELFEEAPEDEDIEETIEAPKEAAESESGGDSSSDPSAEEAALEDDFGFDPVDESSDSAAEDDFSFDDDVESASESEDSGTEEGPKRPFDLPESPQVVGAPEDSLSDVSEQTSPSAVVGESGALFAGNVDSSVPEGIIPESDPLGPEKTAAFVPDPVEPLKPVADTVEAVAPLVAAVATTASVATSVVTEASPEDTVASVAASSPPLGRCIGAFIYDFILLAIVGISFIVAAEAAMSTAETSFIPSLETLIDLSVPYFLVLFFLAFGYFTLFHFLVGQTPGKMLTRLRVETIEGEPLSFSQAFLRSVGGLLQLLPAGLGYLVMLTSSERRGWNDRLAGTRVVALRDSS